MKTSSAKAKGRRACQEAKDLLLQYAPGLEPDDIVVTSSGATGEDLKLSPVARLVYPFAFECKNVEKLNIWSALEQAESHVKNANIVPAVVFKRNGERLKITMDFEAFLDLINYYKSSSL